jgi:hypothetical protein
MRRSALIAGLLALSLGSVPAFAFQEMPEPPPADMPAAAPQAEALQLGTPGGATAPEAEEGGLSLFGYTVLQLMSRLGIVDGQRQPYLHNPRIEPANRPVMRLMRQT